MTDDPPPVMCGATCSLREAVTAANGTPGPDTIELQGGQTYTLSIPVGNGGVLAGDLDISDDVTIETVGDGGNATIDGNGRFVTTTAPWRSPEARPPFGTSTSSAA